MIWILTRFECRFLSLSDVDNKLSSFWGGSGFVMSPQWVPLPRSKITVCPSDYDHFVWTESLSVASSTLAIFLLYQLHINSTPTPPTPLCLSSQCLCDGDQLINSGGSPSYGKVNSCVDHQLFGPLGKVSHSISLFTSLGSCGGSFSEYSVGECHVLVSLCRRLSPEYSGMYST